MLSITIKNLQSVKKRVDQYGNQIDKAVLTAMRVEGFRVRRLMQSEIRAGAPGGRRFAQLSLIRQTQGAYKGGSLRRFAPLFKLARAIGYKVDQKPFALTVGFDVKSTATSTTWQRLARMHQKGFEKSADDRAGHYTRYSIRESLAFDGSSIYGNTFLKSRSRRRNVFFLRKETRQLRTPARPMIVPFWERHHQTIRRNIAENTIKKMRGERI